MILKQSKSLLLATCLLLAFSSQAGIISSILKAGKKAGDDIDLPSANLGKLDLPDGVTGIKAQALFGTDGSWQAKIPGETRLIPADDLDAINKATGGERLQLVIPERDIPHDISGIHNVASNVDIHISGKNGVFSVKRGADKSQLQLEATAVKLNLPASGKLLKESLWQLQRPFNANPLHTIGLGFKQQAGAGVFGHTLDDLIGKPSKFRQKTLLINDPKADKTALIKTAEEYDINLVFAEGISPKKLKSQLQKNFDDEWFTGSTADFYNTIAAPNLKNSGKLEMSISGSGNRVAIQGKKPTQKVTATTDNRSSTFVYIPTPNFSSYFTSEERQQELDNRIHPLLPAWLTFLLLFSSVVGLVRWADSRWLFQKFWPLKPRGESNWLGRSIYRLLRAAVFFMLFLPLFGLPAAIIGIFRSIGAFFRWIGNKLRPA